MGKNIAIVVLVVVLVVVSWYLYQDTLQLNVLRQKLGLTQVGINAARIDCRRVTCLDNGLTVSGTTSPCCSLRA